MVPQFLDVLFVNWYWRIAAAVVGLLSAVGTIQDNLPENRRILLFNYVPDWRWYVWVIAGLVTLLVIAVAAFYRYFTTKEDGTRQQQAISRCFWSGREVQRKCLKRKRVMNEAQRWAVKVNAVVSTTLGPGYGVRFKADFGAPTATPPSGVKDVAAWLYLENRLYKLHEITNELTQQSVGKP